MDRSLLFSFVVVVLVGSASVSHANLPAQIYWHTKLPNTPMPAAIRELLRPDLEDEKPTSVAVGKGGVNVDAGYGKPGGTYVDVGKGGVHVDAGKDKPSGTTVGAGKGGVHVYTGHKGKPVVVHVGHSPFLYRYAATADQLHDDPAVALFFLEKDLRPGSEMKLQFYETQPGSTFRTRLVADSIPFSSAKTAAIFKRLSIDPNSPEAEAMKKTLETCESPANGEEKLCATSLESMVDFATAKLGSHVKALATEADKDSPRQVYTVEAAAQKMAGAKSVSCHSESYAYAVFFCHETRDTAAYVVPLVGKDGRKVAAVAVCHQDTSKWNPGHVAFRVLKVKPGSVPVCHFLPQDHIVWVPSN